eukprot:1468074-Amphidinium_carterae.2
MSSKSVTALPLRSGLFQSVQSHLNMQETLMLWSTSNWQGVIFPALKPFGAGRIARVEVSFFKLRGQHSASQITTLHAQTAK